jgi:hypothetical protein
VLAVLTAREDYRRVVLALDRGDLEEWHGAERNLAVAVAGIATAGAHGRAVVIAPDGAAARAIAPLVGDGADVVADARPRRVAVAAIATETDLVLVPARSGAAPLHRDAAAVAALPVGCSVAGPTRPHAASALVTGTPTLVGSRSG